MAGKHVGSDLYPNSNSVYPDRVNRAYMEGYSGVANSHAANSPAALATTAGKTGQQEECAPGTAAVYNQYLQNFDAIWRLQSFLLSEAARWRLPIIRNNDMERTVRDCMKMILDHLSRDFAKSPGEVFSISS